MTLTNLQKLSLLSEHYLLRLVPEGALEELVGLSETKIFSSGESIFRKGEIADCMMVVVAGKVRISAPATTGDDITFATILEGEVFGEIALIDGYERSADAVAVEETELLIVSSSDFMPVLSGNAELCIDLLKVLCNRIRQTNVILEDFSYIDLRRRLAKRLLYMSGSESISADSSNISVRVSRQQLLVMLGVSEDSVLRELANWQESGLLEIDGDWITVINADALATFLKD